MSRIGLVIIGLLAWAIVISYFVNDKSRKFVIWLFWDFSGLRFVWKKIRPPKTTQPDERPPATFMIWAFGIFGIYIAIFGLASQRYESRVNSIQNKASFIVSQLSTPGFKNAIGKIPALQKMKCPHKPDILVPPSVIISLFSEGQNYEEVVELMKETIENCKDSLESVNLSGVNLQEADLSNANLQGAELSMANLQKAKLMLANLKEANLSGHKLIRISSVRGSIIRLDSDVFAKDPGADLRGADLSGADLRKAILKRARLKGAKITGAILEEAYLQEAELHDINFVQVNLIRADLRNTVGLDFTLLCKASSLYKAKLDSDIENSVKEWCPDLLKKPEWLKE